MNTRGLTRQPLSILLTACAVFTLLLSACQPPNVSIGLATVESTEIVVPAATQPPTDEPVAPATQTPAEATQPPSASTGEITLNLAGIAQDQTIETVAAVLASADRPWWEVAPEYRSVTLLGYPVTGHLMKPQIFIYPVADLAGSSEAAGKMATDLQALLQARQPVNSVPFLPLYNAAQVMHPQVQYLNFKNGEGVRFLTQFSQGFVAINNTELIYSFQGLTSDGKYYVAAVLPVTHPELPATQNLQGIEGDDFATYLTKTAAWLEQQPSGSFTPDLAKLDALIQSIEVK